MMLFIVASRRKKSPRKSNIARERARDTSGLFLSSSGHRKSAGRYAGISGLPALPSLTSITRRVDELAAGAYARLDTVHDETLRLDLESAKREAQKSLRAAEEQRSAQLEKLAEDKKAAEKKAAKLVAEKTEQIADERSSFAKKQRGAERVAARRTAEQRDQMEKWQLAMAAEQADRNIKLAEEWAKTASSLNVSPMSPTPSPPPGAEQTKFPGM